MIFAKSDASVVDDSNVVVDCLGIAFWLTLVDVAKFVLLGVVPIKNFVEVNIVEGGALCVIAIVVVGTDAATIIIVVVVAGGFGVVVIVVVVVVGTVDVVVIVVVVVVVLVVVGGIEVVVVGGHDHAVKLNSGQAFVSAISEALYPQLGPPKPSGHIHLQTAFE
jgi:hypothetical protein